MSSEDLTVTFVNLLKAYVLQRPALNEDHLRGIINSPQAQNPFLYADSAAEAEVVQAASATFDKVLAKGQALDWHRVQSEAQQLLSRLTRRNKTRERVRKLTKPLPPSATGKSEAVNERILRKLTSQVESFPATSWSGLSSRRIQQTGAYDGEGVRLTKEDLAMGQLYAGLAVLARDMHAYLAGRAPHSLNENAVRLFQVVTSDVSEKDRQGYGAGAFPNYEGQPVADLPTGLAAAAARGKPVVAPLANPAIVHEWTVKPGKKLFQAFIEKFGPKLKETICGKGGPYKQFEKGLLGQTALPTTIASAILTSGLSTATFWYPLAVYLGLLLVKAGLKTYCESGKRARPSSKPGARKPVISH